MENSTHWQLLRKYENRSIHFHSSSLFVGLSLGCFLREGMKRINMPNKNITGTIGIAEISKENNSKTVSQSGAFTGMKRNISATPNQFLGVIIHRAEAIQHQGSHRRG